MENREIILGFLFYVILGITTGIVIIKFIKGLISVYKYLKSLNYGK